MYINSIYIDETIVLCEIEERKNAPWNNGRINDYLQMSETNKLFHAINSGTATPNFAFKGRLYRMHSPTSDFANMLDLNQYEIIGKIYDDNSCRALSKTQYSDKLVAWSKNYNFDNHQWYKAYCAGRSRFLVANTQKVYGIDVNAFLDRFGSGPGRFMYEHEVLFPLMPEYILHEYTCTPQQFHRYMRKYPLDMRGYPS